MKKLSFFLISLLLATPCTAATIIVNCDGSGGYLTIQEGIDAAEPNDTVVVAQGTYTGDGNRDLDFDGKAITVRSTDPNDPDITWIDCEDAARGFIFDSGEGPNSVVAGFTIVRGQAENGGAIYCHSSSPTISHCEIWDNHASGNGGGIYGYGTSNPKINNCTINHNSAGPAGGGLYFRDNCNATISCSIICDNLCTGSFGCISCGVSGGGGVSCRESIAMITNCCISNNVCEETTGGGLYARANGAEINISNSILWANQCAFSSGAQIACGHAFNSPGSMVAVSYSDVEGGEADTYAVGGTIEWGLGNIDADPCFVGEYYDCHLKSQADGYGVTSLCIDAGNPGCPLGDEPNDANNVRINMGAYGGTAEASKTPADWGILADLTNDRIVDFNDLAAFVDYWLDSGQCIPSDLNRNQSVDFYDFVEFATCWSEGVE